MTKSNILQRLSATVQFILGFLIGIGLIAGVSGSLIFAYYKKMSTVPQKPDFPASVVPSETPESASNETETSTSIEPLESTTSPEEELEEDLEVIPEEPESPAQPELPPSAYYAQVTWPQGLSLRAEPSINAGRIGGIGFDETIIILEDSADGKWQRVRLPWSEQEGWVKAGNIKRTSY
ncbi:MAG: SH3 domain-containing protein [Pleurocapsa sp. MO_226.B13]|nr:SH3 domain-containing protein [Pleurocapsa sp. MO_226.B13]